MANLNDLMGFALTVTTRYEKESRVESSFSTAPAPGFQIEYQINWKVDASSRGIQSKMHLKSKCKPPNNFLEMQLSKRPASAAGTSCAKEQQSRSLLRIWMGVPLKH